MGSVRKRDGKWQARYRDHAGGEHAQTFARKIDADRWLTDETAKLNRGTWTDPKTAKTTVAEWAATWYAGFQGRPSTRRTTRAALSRIEAEFGHLSLMAVRPSEIRRWIGKLRAEGLSDGYIHNLHGKLAQLMTDAVHDGLIPKSPCSRRTSPPPGGQRPFVATTKQVWALHDAMPPHLRAAVLLGACAGLRAGEACGLRPGDVDFAGQMIRPAVQYPAAPLKTEISYTAIPVPQSLLDDLLAHMAQWPGDTVLVTLTGAQLPPNALQRAVRETVTRVPGLPEGFHFHDLRHYFASLLIASGMDVKTVQARVRHGNGATTLDVYGHLWPDSDDPTRAAIDVAFRDHAERVTGQGSGPDRYPGDLSRAPETEGA